MLDLFLDKTGIKNYSIWNLVTELFSYYGIENLDYSNTVMTESDVVVKKNVLERGGSGNISFTRV